MDSPLESLSENSRSTSNDGPGVATSIAQLDALLANSDQIAHDQKLLNAHIEPGKSHDKTRNAKTKTTLISAKKNSVVAELEDLWDYRELIFSFVRRDLTTRYRQTILGVGWAIVQPVCMMLVFTLFLGRFVHPANATCPYPVFVYTALLVWQYISASLSRCSNSVLDAGGLIKKVYFPRLSVPVASVLPSLMDFLIGLVSLIVLMAIYGMAPSPRVCVLPVYAGLAIITSLGIGLWASALHVRYRDVHHLIPFGLQLWLFASPVIYSNQQIPAYLKPMSNLNPLVGIIEGFRWSLLGTTGDIVGPTLWSALVAFVVLVTGLIYFRSVEDLFADYL